MKKLIVIGMATAITALGLSIFAARFDADAAVQKYRNRVVNEALNGKWPNLAADQMTLSRFHRGEGPCFTYAPPSVSSPELDQIAAEFKQRNLPAAEGLIILAGWSALDEESRHGSHGYDELSGSYKMTGRLQDRLLLWLCGSKILAAHERVRRQGEADLEERIRQHTARLSSEQRVALQTIWQQHQTTLTIPALSEISKRLRPE